MKKLLVIISLLFVLKVNAQAPVPVLPVNTVQQMVNYAGTNPIVMVKDTLTGGYFYFSTDALTADNINIYARASGGFWVRNFLPLAKLYFDTSYFVIGVNPYDPNRTTQTLTINPNNLATVTYVNNFFADTAFIFPFNAQERTNDPPASPADSTWWLIGDTPTGIWITHENQLAQRIGTGYAYYDEPTSTIVNVITPSTQWQKVGDIWVLKTTFIVNNGNLIRLPVRIGTQDDYGVELMTHDTTRFGVNNLGDLNYPRFDDTSTSYTVGVIYKNGKFDTVHARDLILTTTGSSGAATLINNVLNIPQYSGGGVSETWQQTLINGSDLTQDNNIAGNQHNLSYLNNSGVFLQSNSVGDVEEASLTLATSYALLNLYDDFGHTSSLQLNTDGSAAIKGSLDSSTDTAPNLVGIGTDGNWHKYAAPSGGGGTLQQATDASITAVDNPFINAHNHDFLIDSVSQFVVSFDNGTIQTAMGISTLGQPILNYTHGSLFGAIGISDDYIQLQHGNNHFYISKDSIWYNEPSSGGTIRLPGAHSGIIPDTLARLYDIRQAVSGAVTPAALTKTDDANVTLTLGGTPATSLLQATSLTLGWTGTLAATRGGTGTGTVATGDLLYGSGTNAWSKLSIGTTGQHLVIVGGLPVWRDTTAATAGTITGAGNLSPLFTTGVSGANITFTLSNAAANTVLGNATSGSTTPSYGQIVNGQITNATIVATTKLSATGTPSASNFLRGDNTWATPSGGSTFTRQVITSGSSGTVTGGNYIVTIDPAATLAAYTLTMPASPSDLDVVEVDFGGTLTSGTIVTALTVIANSGQTILDNTPPVNATADNTLLYRWRNGNNTWYRFKP